MEENKKTILVPWDFTHIAENALLHAIKIADTFDNDITLLNIVKKQKEVDEILVKLNAVAEETHKKYNFKPRVLAVVGSIFSTISEVASEINANLVIMGTHGIKGMQKLTGSWALKVIVGSKVPFVVIQTIPKEHVFKKILVPFDHKMEGKEKLAWVNYLAKYYKSEILLFKTGTTDELLSKKSNNNIIFAKKYLEEKNIEYRVAIADGKKSFPDETIAYAEKNDADLILIMTTKDIGFKDYVLGATEQEIIANDAKIPVMCINPREDIRKLAGFN
ncbi:MAG: universal stress protein [Bacteroidia bacterium]|nr:universal stress protein [Bacteroidia bacterium]